MRPARRPASNIDYRPATATGRAIQSSARRVYACRRASSRPAARTPSAPTQPRPHALDVSRRQLALTPSSPCGAASSEAASRNSGNDEPPEPPDSHPTHLTNVHPNTLCRCYAHRHAMTNRASTDGGPPVAHPAGRADELLVWTPDRLPRTPPISSTSCETESRRNHPDSGTFRGSVPNRSVNPKKKFGRIQSRLSCVESRFSFAIPSLYLLSSLL